MDNIFHWLFASVASLTLTSNNNETSSDSKMKIASIYSIARQPQRHRERQREKKMLTSVYNKLYFDSLWLFACNRTPVLVFSDYYIDGLDLNALFGWSLDRLKFFDISTPVYKTIIIIYPSSLFCACLHVSSSKLPYFQSARYERKWIDVRVEFSIYCAIW